jgi:hypothetical protein
MIRRCEDPKIDSYRWYGACGIKVCERWHDFANFLADMGPKPTRGHSIERVDNHIGYQPGNCHWATLSEQAENRRNPGPLGRLRVAKKRRKGCSSRFKGVSWYAASGRWNAAITVLRKTINLGRFDSEEEAAKAFNDAAKRLQGEHAVLNEIT